ncbi:LysR family transcriptional regulator [Lactobacillus delbrueckii]|uniref:LysR family transcriptional regulator n=1 Tax=Lactobacillus delbrueckii TaxID=1584 RepID=UPI0021A3AD29|nr:LysR family transcriptional regulator [Lactobacillus delbrueckii]
MDLRQLEVFINLAESLNYSKTAENLHVSQPAVSRIIQRIEGEVSATLFYRNHREVQLTKNGKLFYDDSKSLINSYNKALQRTRNSFNREGAKQLNDWDYRYPARASNFARNDQSFSPGIPKLQDLS